jgi:septum formation protein
MRDVRFILASRSPRRNELLGRIMPAGQIAVVPPRDADEAGFAGLRDLPEIERRLAEIARKKATDVAEQLAAERSSRTTAPRVVIAADTAVVVTGVDGILHVLGQPPDDDSWRDVVRRWFREYYAGRSHRVVTALCVLAPGRAAIERVVTTEVTMIADVERRLEWYIAGGEPRGKAGGYAIQGAGSIFVSHVVGSLSNVIGLPLEALLECLEELKIDVRPDN